MGAVGQGGAFEFGDSLVAFGVGALIDGERHVTSAEQPGHRPAGVRRVLQAFRVETGVAAQGAVAGDVGHHHAERPVALGLQGEDSVVLEPTGERRGQCQGLGEHGGGGFGIAMAAEDGVEGGAEPYQPPAHAQRLHLKGLHEVAQGRATGATGLRRRLRPHPRHQARMPFCACRRFSASSQTTEWGPSMTASVTSSPRCAGRQCMNNASSLAISINAASTR